ncbi:hypothetical protein PIROE2DRAFT_67411, partial [Piromyces sp. E2]
MVMIPTNTDFSIRNQRELSDKIDVEKAIARRINADYQDMIYMSTGYVIAWLRLILYNEKDADFSKELKENDNYKNCDVRIS